MNSVVPLAIEARALRKHYGDTRAVDGIDLVIPRGQFFGLLGPNGSGKTSTVHMLSTLIRPTSGLVRVAGLDAAADPVAVRARVGVVFQDSALDRTLSARENLRFCGMLYGIAPAEIERRSAELLELFGLADKRDVPVLRLSGGQRRALDIARGVMHRPEVLFLDEPTIGLDLPNRRRIWRFIESLRAEHGMTVFLTTHYLEEADDCEQVAFIRKGRIVRAGTPRELIGALGDYVIEIDTAEPDAVQALVGGQLAHCLREGDERLAYLHRGEDLAPVLALQAQLGSRVSAMSWRRPNLNDVFLWVNEAGIWTAPPAAAQAA